MKKEYSFIISETIWNLVNYSLPFRITENYYLQPFYNCRESGFCAINYDWNICIWIYTNRNTDKPSVIVSSMEHNINKNNYDEEAWKTEKSFDSVNEAVRYVCEFIENEYHKRIEENNND